VLPGRSRRSAVLARVPDPRDKRIADVERENLCWQRRAERVEALVELTGKAARPDEGFSSEPGGSRNERIAARR
jgi:hypothetical protein